MKEVSLRFGVSGHLAGTITIAENPGELGLVIPSAGLLHRIGPHRLHVRLARQAAMRGVPSIRFDMPGIGDSLHAPGRATYESQALNGTISAMNLLTERTGVSRFVVAGLCSGADSGYTVAQHDDRVVALYMLEPPQLVFGATSRTLRIVRQLREYGLSFAAKRAWQLLRTGEILRRRSADDDDRAVPGSAEYLEALRGIIRRGVLVRMVYADSSMGRYDLRRLRSQLPAAHSGAPRLSITVIPHSDHLFTRLAAKAQVSAHLLETIDMIQSTDSQSAPTPTSESSVTHEDLPVSGRGNPA